MRILELFSGTKSVTKAMQGHTIVSLDILPKHSPTICANVLEWDYKQYPPGHFDAIWASPPCIEYSILKHNTGMATNMALADAIVLRTLEIIAYYEPDKWFIENPQTGLLKTRPFMTDIPFYDVDYCAYSDWGYKKRTRIWTNVDFSPRLCGGTDACPNMVGRFHKASFGGQGRPKDHTYISVPAGENAHRVPPALIRALFSSPPQ